MKTTKKLLITSMLVAATSTVSLAQAEGFLSKLMGGSKGGADFKSMMAHVPSDTSYIFTNKKPIPKEVMDFHLSRSTEMMDMISKLDPSADGKKESKDSGAFFKALFEDLGKKLTDGKIEDSGLTLEARYLAYGYDMTPIIRFTFGDKKKLMETVKRAEEKSGFKTELTKCGDFDCFIDNNPKDDMSVAFVILENQFAASVFQPSKQGKIIDHLIGKADPKESFSEGKWDDFLKANSYTGFGDGFVNLGNVYNNSKPLIADGMKGKMSDKDADACMAVAQDHIKNVPEIVFGTKKLETKVMDYELLVKTSADVSTVLQGIANKTNIAQRIENPIFDFGINIDFMKLRDALTQYSNFLIKSGETHKCKSVDAKEIRKGMGGMMMAMNMGLTKFKSVYASVADIELDDKMQPKKVDAYISIGTDDPAGLFGMVGMMSPALMGFQLPADGSVVPLPKGAIPSKGVEVPPIFLSKTDKSLNIMVGNDKPVLKNYKSDTKEIMTFAMDGKRYYEKFAELMKVMPQAGGAGQDETAEMMKTMGNMSGKIQQEISADKRGLVINYHVQY